MPTGVFWSFVLSCATDTMRWSSSMPKTVCATARTSRTVCFAGLLGSERTWTSIGRPERSPTTRTAWTPLRRHSSSSSSRSSAAGFLSPQTTIRRSTTHSAWRPRHSPRARSPRPDTAYGHPTTQRGGRALPMLLVGLAWRSDPRETMRSFRPGGGSRTVSGWRRQGLGLKFNESTEAKRDVRRAHSVAHAGELMFQGVSCKRPWFALRPARQHWSQCCSPVALSSGNSKHRLC